MPLQPNRRGVPIKGMNTVAPQRAMSEDHSPSLQDIWYDDGITLRRRLCHSILNTTVAPNGGIKDRLEYSYGAITKEFIQDLTGLISLDTGAAYTSQAITFAGNINTAQLKNLSIIGNGVANAQKYDGTTWSAITTTPAPVGNATIGNIFHTHRGRVYAAGNTALPMTIFISDTITSSGADYWAQAPASGTGQLGYLLDCSGDISSGDVIIGITTHRGFLVVLCKNHVLFYQTSESATSGWNSFLYKSIAGEGCVSHKSIQPIGEETIFLSPNGFKKLSVSMIQGDSQVNDLSSPINNDVKDLVNSPTTVTSDIRSTYNARYGIYMCSISQTTWAYQTSFEGWFKWSGINSVLFTNSSLITKVDAAYSCLLSNTVFRDELSPAVFTAVNMSWTPAPFRAQALEHKPRWRKFELIYELAVNSGTVTIIYYRDLDKAMPPVSATYTLSPTETLNNGMFSGKVELPISGRSELISFDVSDNSNTDLRFKLCEVYSNDGGLR